MLHAGCSAGRSAAARHSCWRALHPPPVLSSVPHTQTQQSAQQHLHHQHQPQQPQQHQQQRRWAVVAAAAVAAGRRSGQQRQQQQQQQQYVEVQPDASDAWRLDPVVQALREGAVGIIPTGGRWMWVCVCGGGGGRSCLRGACMDPEAFPYPCWVGGEHHHSLASAIAPPTALRRPATPADSNPAFVCDLGSRAAVEKLLELKGAPQGGSAKMAILCRSLADVDAYTQGWPPSRAPGQTDMFRIVRRLLPGPVRRLSGDGLPMLYSLLCCRHLRPAWDIHCCPPGHPFDCLVDR